MERTLIFGILKPKLRYGLVIAFIDFHILKQNARSTTFPERLANFSIS